VAGAVLPAGAALLVGAVLPAVDALAATVILSRHPAAASRTTSIVERTMKSCYHAGWRPSNTLWRSGR
jgi:hypothetical protein